MVSLTLPQTSTLSTFPVDAPGASPSQGIVGPAAPSDTPASLGDLLRPGESQGGLRRGPRPLLEVMAPPANRLIDLITEHYPAYEQTTPLPDHVRHAMQMVQVCHTAALGGHVETCPDGHITRIFYNRCGHRFCPRCAGRQRRAWLRARRAKHLPVRHYHVVFTLPHAFNELWRLNYRRMGDLLFHSATGALRALLADPKRLGAEPGMTVTLETWDDRLCLHPHLHCLVTGGGLSPEGEWVDVPHPRCLVAVTPLMWEFRTRFCRALKEVLEQERQKQERQEDANQDTPETFTLPTGTTPRLWVNRVNKANRQHWEVFIAKPPEDGGPTTTVIEEYLADDIAGGPLSAIRLEASPPAPQPDRDLRDAQLLSLKSAPMSAQRLEDPHPQDGQVTFRWGAYNPDTGIRERDQTETLPVDEFLRRYLQHVPPSGYQTVRHYGLSASGNVKKDAYDRCCDLLSDREPASLPPVSNDAPDTDAWRQQHTCPVCGQPLIVSSYVPSSLTGHVIPRVPLGHVFAPSASPGGGHDP